MTLARPCASLGGYTNLAAIHLAAIHLAESL